MRPSKFENGDGRELKKEKTARKCSRERNPECRNRGAGMRDQMARTGHSNIGGIKHEVKKNGCERADLEEAAVAKEDAAPKNVIGEKRWECKHSRTKRYERRRAARNRPMPGQAHIDRQRQSESWSECEANRAMGVRDSEIIQTVKNQAISAYGHQYVMDSVDKPTIPRGSVETDVGIGRGMHNISGRAEGQMDERAVIERARIARSRTAPAQTIVPSLPCVEKEPRV